MAGAAFAALADASDPSLQLDRTIRDDTLRRLIGFDYEDHLRGARSFQADDSLWLADDNGKAIYEIDPVTGAWQRTIPRSVFNLAPQVGGGPAAGADRTNDFESLAYDVVNERLYVFSGPCCAANICRPPSS